MPRGAERGIVGWRRLGWLRASEGRGRVSKGPERVREAERARQWRGCERLREAEREGRDEAALRCQRGATHRRGRARRGSTRYLPPTRPTGPARRKRASYGMRRGGPSPSAVCTCAYAPPLPQVCASVVGRWTPGGACCGLRMGGGAAGKRPRTRRGGGEEARALEVCGGGAPTPRRRRSRSLRRQRAARRKTGGRTPCLRRCVDAVSCEHRLAPALRGQGLEDSRPVGVPASSAPCGTAQASEGRG